MTRINLIEPSKLSDQHLKAELRELNRIGNLFLRFSKNPSKLPEKFSLGTGHVKFFYNKGRFLEKRFQDLREELNKRNFQSFYQFPFNNTWKDSPEFYKDWNPSKEDLKVSNQRILEKISMKESWYKFYRESLPENFKEFYEVP